MLLTKFFNGDYSSSKVKIDTKTSTISLIIYFMRCIAMLATFGFISPFWRSSVDAQHSHTPRSAACDDDAAHNGAATRWCRTACTASQFL